MGALGGLTNGSQDAASLKELLAEVAAPELQQIALRLAKSSDAMRQSLIDLEDEQKELHREHDRLKDAIAVTMADVNRLKIGADNLPEPEFEFEGGNSVAAAALRLQAALLRPDGALAGAADVHRQVTEKSMELGQQITERSQELGERLSSGFSSFQKSVEALTSTTGEGGDTHRELGERWSSGFSSFQKSVGEALASNTGEGGVHLQSVSKDVRKSFTDAVGFLSQATGLRLTASDEDEDEAQEGDVPGSAPTFGTLFSYLTGAPAHAPRLRPDDAPPGSEYANSGIGSVAEATKLDEFVRRVPLAEEEAPLEQSARAAIPEAVAASAPSDDGEASLVIEARLSGGGEEYILRVCTTDRVKEVTARFIQEHSLKDWYEAPVRAFLMEAEEKAETFPVKVEADLDQLRKQYAQASRSPSMS